MAITLHYGVLIGYNANKIFWHGIHHHFRENEDIDPITSKDFLLTDGMVDSKFFFEIKDGKIIYKINLFFIKRLTNSSKLIQIHSTKNTMDILNMN